MAGRRSGISSPWQLLAGAVVTCLLQACAGTPASGDVVTLPIETVRTGGTALPVRGYVSTSQPDRAALEAIAAAGYAGVIDLRAPGEDRGIDEADAVSGLGMRYVSLPVAGPEDVTWQNAELLDRILADFDGPVLLHCATGNRVGALFALREKAAGADNETALAKGREAGLTRYEDVVLRRLQEPD
ncbi:MAG: sulfur transferase domain-containing protein [Woeseiaceae bacterium]|nr:sulfur transferase domain-containing protein [Woeseiaceae bacterium]